MHSSQRAPRSAWEATPIGARPSCRQARATRTATSPRLAISTRRNMKARERSSTPRRATTLQRRMSILVALIAALARVPEEGDLRSELARLESSSASERGAAERWLAAHLAPDDFALV